MAEFEAREIGARISKARKECGLTQEELAALASFSKRSLQDYEGGLRIPYQHLAEIGRLLNRSTEWFLHGSPPPAEAGGVEERLDRIEQALRAVEEAVARFDPGEQSDQSSK